VGLIVRKSLLLVSAGILMIITAIIGAYLATMLLSMYEQAYYGVFYTPPFLHVGLLFLFAVGFGMFSGVLLLTRKRFTLSVFGIIFVLVSGIASPLVFASEGYMWESGFQIGSPIIFIPAAALVLASLSRANKRVALAIFLSTLLIATLPVSYFIALFAVSDAVGYGIGFGSRAGSISVESTKATLSGVFIFENRANIQLMFDVNINVYVVPVENQPFDSNFGFNGGPFPDEAQFIGKVSAKNALAPAHGNAEVLGSFDITSEDALNVLRTGNFTVRWATHEITVTGSFFGWRITRIPAFE
jgi:hypothetical protein